MLLDRLVLPSLEKFGYEGARTCIFPLNTVILSEARQPLALSTYPFWPLWRAHEGYCGSSHFALLHLADHHTKLEVSEGRGDQGKEVMTDKLPQELTALEGIRAGILPQLQSLEFCSNILMEPSRRLH